MIDFIRIPEERLKILKKEKKFKDRLEKFSNSKISFNEDVQIKAEDVLQLLRVKEAVKAFGRGFDFETALNLLDEQFYLEIIEVRNFSGKSENRMETLKGRVIGSAGKTKNIIEKYTETKIAIYGKTISIIGRWDGVVKAKQTIEMLLSGSSHNTVYRFLERGEGEKIG
jgi:ribosomal RNA assembly protein